MKQKPQWVPLPDKGNATAPAQARGVDSTMLDPAAEVRDLLNAIARRDCMLWAVTAPEVLAAFRRETGNTFAPPKNGLDALIDHATGSAEAFAKEFEAWFDANIWGDPEGSDV